MKPPRVMVEQIDATDGRPRDCTEIRWLMAKARAVAGAEVDASAAVSYLTQEARAWESAAAEVTEYDPESLLMVVEHSPHLEPNIQGYAVNIDGHGQRAVPAVDWLDKLDSEEAFQEVKAAMEYERWLDAQAAADEEEREIEPPEDIPEDEVQAKVDEIHTTMRREKFIFEAWFRNCCSEMSFTKLRRIVRYDREAIGWGAMEMLRDGKGRLQRLRYIPGHTIRPLNETPELVTVIERNDQTVLSENREIAVRRRFPRFVQRCMGQIVYFKSPGDPRAISRTTGRAYKDVNEMRREDNEGPDAMPAHELLLFSQHSPRTLASPPRWISGLVRALGSREADETNYFYLKNKSMLSGILFVGGGRISAQVRERLEQRIRAEMRGAENAGRIMVVEAEPFKSSLQDRSIVPSMHWQSLRDSHTTDAMFTEYDSRNADSIGALFRQSPLMRGYTPSNLNRATAEVVLQFTEDQVYAPERMDFDWVINKIVMPEIGIKYHLFESNSPRTQSVDEISEFVKAVAPQGALLPSELRQVASRVLNSQLTQIDEEWVNWPMAMTLAGMTPASTPSDSSLQEQNPGVVSERMRQLEERVAQIANEEFREAGLNFKTTVRSLPQEALFHGQDDED